MAAAERRVAAANAEVGVASAAFFPAVTLGEAAVFRRHAFSSGYRGRHGLVGGSGVGADGVRRRRAPRRKGAAVAGYDERVGAYRQTVLSAFQDVEDNLAAERLLAEEATEHAAAVTAAQRSLDISLNQYRAGLVSYLQVATQQTALLTNQRAAVSVTVRRFSASVQLVRALGGGWERSSLPARVN